MKKSPCLFFLAAIPLVLASCATATSVRFDVEHPPLVDFRGLNRVSIIPFERGLPREFEYLSTHATTALTNGIRNNLVRANLTLVEPQALAHVAQHNFRHHVDVFIVGRITNINSSYTRRHNTRIVRGETVIVTSVTLTAIVDIEYSYIRASDGSVLGTFRKRERFSETADFIGGGGLPPPTASRPGWNHGTWLHPDWNRPGPWDQPRWFDPEWDRDRKRRARGGRVFPRRESWEERVAAAAIGRFSQSMDRELAPWVTRVERTLLRAGSEPELDHARSLARMGSYELALRAYREVFQRDGNVSAGFNAAILLAAIGNPAEALALLEELDRGFRAAGRNTPRFILTEIKKMAAMVYRLAVLEERRELGAGAVADALPARARLNVVAATIIAPADAREISGTVNLNLAKVYALSDSIAYADDGSIWSKIVASAEADSLGGSWAMRLPETAPPLLWFVVADRGYNLYITQTALSTQTPIVLNTAQMTRLE